MSIFHSPKFYAAAFATVITALPAQGQVASEGSAIAAVAVDALIETGRIPRGEYALDPRPLVLEARGLAVGPIRADDRTRELARALRNAAVLRIDENVRCEGGVPPSCSLVHGVASFALSEPRVTGSSAEVFVRVRSMSGLERQPLSSMDLEIDLHRVDGAWMVVGITTLRIS